MSIILPQAKPELGILCNTMFYKINYCVLPRTNFICGFFHSTCTVYSKLTVYNNSCFGDKAIT